MDRLDSQELILDLCGFIETCVYWILTKVELHVNITGTMHNLTYFIKT